MAASAGRPASACCRGPWGAGASPLPCADAHTGAPCGISSRRNGGKEGPGGFALPGPPSTGDHGGGRLYGQGKKPTAHCRPFRRHKFQIIRFAASGKAHSFHCALAPVAALRFPGQTGPPIAPLLFPGSLYPPLAALRRETLPTEPASLGFGGGPVFTYVTGAAAPRAARIGITLQALWVVALYRLGPPGRRRCHATEILWKSRESGPPPKPSGGNELSGLPGSKRSVA